MPDANHDDLPNLDSVLQKYDRDVEEAERLRAARQTEKSDFFIKFIQLRQSIIHNRLTHFMEEVQAKGHYATIEISDRMGLLGPDPSITLSLEPKLYNLFSQTDTPAYAIRFSTESTARQILVLSVLDFDQSNFQRFALDRVSAAMVDKILLQFAKQVFRRSA